MPESFDAEIKSPPAEPVHSQPPKIETSNNNGQIPNVNKPAELRNHSNQNESENQDFPLAAGMDQDPRFKLLCEEINNNWKSIAPHLYKDPKHANDGWLTITMDAQREFRRKYPEDAKKYDEIEKTRVYENPAEDPALIKIDGEIENAVRTNIRLREFEGGDQNGIRQDPRFKKIYEELAKSGNPPLILDADAYRTFWQSFPDDAKEYDRKEQARLAEIRSTNEYKELAEEVRIHEGTKLWNEFIEAYPDKAKAYAMKGHPIIKPALELYEQANKSAKKLPVGGAVPTE